MRRLVFLTALIGYLTCAPAALADNKAELADAVYDYNKSYWAHDIVMKLMNFKLSPGVWAKMLEKDGYGISTTSNAAHNMEEFAKKNGWGSLEEAEFANSNDRAHNKEHVSEAVDALKNKMGFTLQADQLKGTEAEWDLVHRYMNAVTEFLSNRDWKPKAKTPFITLVVTPTVNDITVTVSPDGKNFTVSAPSNHEIADWDAKISRGLQKAGK